MTNGLLAQLPNTDDLAQSVTLVEDGLNNALGQFDTWRDPTDPNSPLGPLAEALGSIEPPSDVEGLLAPLDAAREQIVGALPTGLDDLLAAVEPLLAAVDQLLEGSPLEPILADLRAGRSFDDISRDALGLLLDRVVGQLGGLAANAAGPEARAAIEGILADAAALGPSAAPEAIADFIAERLLGAPLAPLGQLAGLRGDLAAGAQALLDQSGAAVDAADGAFTDALAGAAARLEGIGGGGAWPETLVALRAARDRLTGLRGAMLAVPAGVNTALDALDLERYREGLRAALATLADSTGGGPAALGRAASLEQLIGGMVEPLDELSAQISSLSPGAFTSLLRARLDALGALLDAMGEQVRDNPVMALFDDLQQVMAEVAGAISAVRDALDGGLAAVLAAADAVASQVEAVREQLEALFQSLVDLIEAIDAVGLAAALEQALDQFVGLLEQIPIGPLRDLLDTALSTVENLVEQLAEAAQAALEQIEPLAAALEQIDLEPPGEAIADAVLAVRDLIAGIDLSLLPDSVMGQLRGVVDPFVGEVQGSLADIRGELTSGFEGVVRSVRDLVTSIQQRLEQFASAVGNLDPSALLQPLVSLFDQLDQALAGINGAALVAPLGEVIADIRAGVAQADPAALLESIEQAFEQQVMEPVRALHPAELLQPLAEAFAPVAEQLAALDFSDAIQGLGQSAGELIGESVNNVTGAADPGSLPGMGGVADQTGPLLNLLRPGTSIEDWSDGLSDLLGSYRPSAILAPVAQALEPLDTWLDAASDTTLLALGQRLQASLDALDRLEPPDATFRQPLEGAAAAIEARQPAALLSALAAPYDRLRDALAAIDRATLPAGAQAAYDEAAALVAALDPQPVLAPLQAAFAGLPARVRQLASAPAGVDELRAEFGPALSVVAGAFPAFLRGPLSPEALRAGLDAFSPAAQLERLEARFDAFLATAERFGPAIQAAVEQFMAGLGERIANLSPAALFERFDDLFAPIRAALEELSPAAIGAALEDTYQQLVARLDQLHPRVIRELAQPLFDAVLTKLDELQTALLDTLAAAADQALGRVRGLLRDINPQALVVGLGNLFDLIEQRLGELGLGGLLERLAAAFERLGSQLTAVLDRTAGAVDQLAEAI